MYILSFDPNYVSWFKVFYITVLGIFELSLCPLALQIKPINYAFYAKKESKLFMPKKKHTHTPDLIIWMIIFFPLEQYIFI